MPKLFSKEDVQAGKVTASTSTSLSRTAFQPSRLPNTSASFLAKPSVISLRQKGSAISTFNCFDRLKHGSVSSAEHSTAKKQSRGLLSLPRRTGTSKHRASPAAVATRSQLVRPCNLKRKSATLSWWPCISVPKVWLAIATDSCRRSQSRCSTIRKNSSTPLDNLP